MGAGQSETVVQRGAQTPFHALGSFESKSQTYGDGQVPKSAPDWYVHGVQRPMQLVPSQVGATPPGGAGHGVHEVPQLAIDVFETHAPEQT